MKSDLPIDDLLQPSLTETKNRPIYSVGALFAAAFFGGSVAVCIMALLNSQRLNRLVKDAFWVFGALISSLGVLWFFAHDFDSEDVRTLRLINRGVAFALVGAFYLLYQKQYRSMKVLGSDTASPYLPVIVASLIGYGCMVGIGLSRNLTEIVVTHG